MDLGVLGSNPSNCADCSRQGNLENDQVLVNRKTLQAVLEKCQRALELINTTNCVDEDDEKRVESESVDDDQGCGDSSPLREQLEVDEICDFLKSKVEFPEFLVKTESTQASLLQNITGTDSLSTPRSSQQDILMKKEKRKTLESMVWKQGHL